MNTVLFGKSRIGLAMTLTAGFCASAGLAATLDVPANTEVTAEASATYEAINVEGTLIVPSGITVDTVDTGTVTLGSTSAAKLIVDGGTFGRDPVSATKNTPALNIGGENGGSAKISLVNGGAFKCGDTKINANTEVDASGYIDYLTVDGDSTLTCRDFYNNATAPARTRILSGTATFTTEGGASYTHYKGGSWVFDVAGGATILFSRAYRNWEALTSADSVRVDFTGVGDVAFTGANDNSFTIRSGTTFSHSGKIVNKARPLVFNDGVVIGDSVSGVEAKGPVQFKGNVNIGDIEVSGSGVLNGPATGTAKITLGRADRDSTINGAAFAADTTLVLDKVGAGELTVSATTPYLPELNVEDGAVRILGDLTCAKMTLAEGTSVVVDGGCWTIEGAQLEQAAGATISMVNKGNIILKVSTAEVPTFAPGTTLDVLEYWIDGVQQPNGTYSCGGATIVAYKYSEDDLTIWTNEGKPGESHAFSSGEQYKGFSLVKADAPLCFTGGPVVLGSAGIVVDNASDAAATFDFNLPVMPAVSQTWDFGTASAVFRQPLVMAKGVADDPTLNIYSDAALEFATTNSTFVGPMTVSGRTVRVSGPYALGSCDDAATIKVDRSTYSDAGITFAGTTCNRKLTVAHYGTKSAALVFRGTNTFNGAVTLSNSPRAYYDIGSRTEFLGGADYYNYVEFSPQKNSTVVYGGVLKLTGYAGSRSFNMNPAVDATGTALIRFEGTVSVCDTTKYKVVLGRMEVEFGRDYAFTEGLVSVSEDRTVDLFGHSQRFTALTGGATVKSTGGAAFVEIDTPAESTATNACKFSDLASFKMVGAGTLRLIGASDSAGSIAVENGSVILDAAWPNVTSVSVSGAGALELVGARNIGKSSVLSLAGTGGLVLPPGGIAKVSELRLTDPATGETSVFKTGSFDASNSFGLISGGTVQVGKSGLILIFR